MIGRPSRQLRRAAIARRSVSRASSGPGAGVPPARQGLEECLELEPVARLEAVRKALEVIALEAEAPGEGEGRLVGRLDDHLAGRAGHLGPDVIAPGRPAGHLDHSERAVPEAQHRDRGVDVVAVAEALVDQDVAPRRDLIDLADEEAGQVEVMDAHVQERAAAVLDELGRRRIGVPRVRPELLDPAELAGVDQLAWART